MRSRLSTSAASRTLEAATTAAPRTRRATAACARRSTPTARRARRRACAIKSSTSRRSSRTTCRASPPRRGRLHAGPAHGPAGARPQRQLVAPAGGRGALRPRVPDPLAARLGRGDRARLRLAGGAVRPAHQLACTRLRRPPGERDRAPYDDQALDGLAALEGYTTGAAYVTSDEDRLEHDLAVHDRQEHRQRGEVVGVAVDRILREHREVGAEPRPDPAGPEAGYAVRYSTTTSPSIAR